MSADTITTLNFIIHSLVIGAAAWLLVRFIIRDALRRCILANLAVLMCLFAPQNISFQDLLPQPSPAPVLPSIPPTFKASWRITVAPALPSPTVAGPLHPSWGLNEVVIGLTRLSWLVTAALLLRLALQCLSVQRWAWGLRHLDREEMEFLRHSVLECAGPPALSSASETAQSSRGLEHSKTLSRIRVFDHTGTPCVAGWFFPVIAVPASAFGSLTPHQWRWLLRHEGEHLRIHDTLVVLLQKIVRSFLWWNPFAHALIEEYARAREEACDAAAVGEEADHAAYADFLLEWAATSTPQSACVMPISHSLPARRLKLRLVALMEARGVRKKLGALFVLASAAFFLIVPVVAASFGITIASAQDAPKPQANESLLDTRVYKVAPDFLASPGVAKTARELLEQKGVSFPPGASAIYQPATSQLVVRNTRTNIQLIESIIDQLQTVPGMALCTCKLIQANDFIGAHESILSQKEADELIRSAMQQKGADVLSAPSISMKFDQRAMVEVGQEVMPKVLPDGKLSGVMKFVGSKIKLTASSPVEGKTTLEAKVDLGLDLDSATPWLPSKDKAADWDRILIFSVASQAALASGETLLLHLKTSKKPVTVLITATALKPDGQNAGSFNATSTKVPPASQGRDMPEKNKAAGNGSDMATRVYRVPADFGKGKKPVEYLEKNGVVFAEGTDVQLADGSMTVRNTQKNLDLIEGLLLKNMTADGPLGVSIKLSVHVVEVEEGKTLGEWNPEKMTWRREPDSAPVSIRQAPPEVRHLFSAAGVMTEAQFQTLLGSINGRNGVLLDSLPGKGVKNNERAVFAMPAALGGGDLAVRPLITSSSGSLSLALQFPDLIPSPKRLMTSTVMVWDGQTVAFSGIPSEKEKVFRVIFITARLDYPADDGKK
ncbi:M56 family metallopeptidase [Prosthecobacter sp.]|uniref:M56 family metallopeptidase n=1 Tax=Prosthecobacter sp. TaxID=1965333 RepID=UPI00378310DB